MQIFALVAGMVITMASVSVADDGTCIRACPTGFTCANNACHDVGNLPIRAEPGMSSVSMVDDGTCIRACPTGYVCVNNACHDVGNLPIRAEPVMSSVSFVDDGTCIRACPTGYVCANNACLDVGNLPIRSEPAMSSGSMVNDGTCIRACPTGYVCSNNACLDVGNRPIRAESVKLSTREEVCTVECPIGWTCAGDVCTNPIDVPGCMSACESGQVCVNGECRSASKGSANLSTRKEVCTVECPIGWSCAGNVCTNPVDVPGCMSACESGQVCVNGECRSSSNLFVRAGLVECSAVLGQECANDSQCLSACAECHNGFCRRWETN